MDSSLWLRETPGLAGTRDAPLTHTEVAVVGGGVAGVCTALHLARRGIHTTILEAGEVACRASGRNDGQLLLGLGEHYNRIVGQHGAERARSLWQFLRDNNQGLKAELLRSGIDCTLHEAGGLRFAETEHEWSELEESAALLEQEGIPHRLITARNLDTVLPSAGFHGALELPGEAVLQPAAMVRGLATVARAAGVLIHEDTQVLAIAGSAGDFALRTSRGTLGAGAVVHCTSALAPHLDPSGFLAAQLFPFRGQILASAPLPGDLAARFGHQAMSSHFCYEYFRRHGDRFVIGGMRWSVRGEEQGIVDDRSTNDQVRANLLDYVRRHFPILDGVAFPDTWTGIMAGTPDGLPLLGEIPGAAGVFCNLGYNGYGLSFAYLAGQSLAEQIDAGRAAHPAAGMFAPRRFRS
ncbi:MAG: FAD-binding oxidoreductase [Planctomycetes bacterium]|nr:FAD-binding oxidoreductase [Planctomycetota bacterium]